MPQCNPKPVLSDMEGLKLKTDLFSFPGQWLY